MHVAKKVVRYDMNPLFFSSYRHDESIGMMFQGDQAVSVDFSHIRITESNSMILEEVDKTVTAGASSSTDRQAFPVKTREEREYVFKC